MAHELKTALLALLAAIVVVGLLTLGFLGIAREKTQSPRSTVSTYTPQFWTHYTGYWLFPLVLFAPGPLVFGWLLIQAGSEALWLSMFFLLLWVPPMLWGCIYYTYWQHDRHRRLTVYWPEKQFAYTEHGTTATYAFADIRQLTRYRSRKDRGGSYIFYTEVLLANGRCLLVTCLTGDPFAAMASTAQRVTVARWFPWLP